MTISFFLRPCKDSAAAAAAVVGGHFIPEEEKKKKRQLVAESPLFVFKKKEVEEKLEAKPEELPEIEDLEAPPQIVQKLENFDAETRELVLTQARNSLLGKELELLDLNEKLFLLTKQVEKEIQEFEDDFLLLMAIS